MAQLYADLKILGIEAEMAPEYVKEKVWDESFKVMDDQIYVKAEDGKQSVKQYLDAVGKKNGAKISIKRFVRFETGEGMEKREENFAEEVMSQIKH